MSTNLVAARIGASRQLWRQVLADVAVVTVTPFAAERFDRVDHVQALIDELRPIEALRARHGDANNVGVIKATLDLVGLAGGGLRPPLSGLEPDDHAELVRILRAMDVLP